MSRVLPNPPPALAHRVAALLRTAALVLLLSVFGSGCEPGPEVVPLPNDMAGRWITRTPSHADRFLELEPERIVFGTGGETFQAFDIYQITVDRTRALPIYTIEYMTPDGMNELSLWWQERFGVIRLNHRWDMMWRREGDDATLPDTVANRNQARLDLPPLAAKNLRGAS